MAAARGMVGTDDLLRFEKSVGTECNKFTERDNLKFDD